MTTIKRFCRLYGKNTEQIIVTKNFAMDLSTLYLAFFCDFFIGDDLPDPPDDFFNFGKSN